MTVGPGSVHGPSDWFLSAAERGNPSTAIDSGREPAAWTVGNRVEPLIHGADGFVRRAHLLVSARERFRHFNEVRKFCQPVAANDEAQAIVAFADFLVLPFVNKGVIGAATGFHILRRFHETIPGEVDVPIACTEERGRSWPTEI